MSKIFRRPMFRKGGNVGEGIMTGIVDRGNYEVGGSATERLMKVMQDNPVQTVDPVAQFLIQGGLRGLSQTGGGGTLGNLAKAFEPATEKLFTNLGAQDKAKRDLALAGAQLDIEQDYAKDIANIKAREGTGLQKDFSTQRIYDDYVKTRTESVGDLDFSQKPTIEQKFPRGTAEYDSYILRNLRTSENEIAAEIRSNNDGFVPYNEREGALDFESMIPGVYYFDPDKGHFIQNVPPTEDNPDGGFYVIDPYTFEKNKLIPK